MLQSIPLLQNVRVASPCQASWEGMQEVDGDRVHFCTECKKNVYNLSAMSQAQAEGLLRQHEGRLCVRYFQRKDGTILTQNCPVGAAAARRMLIQRSTVAAALTALMAAMAATQISTTTGRIDTANVVSTMGDIAEPETSQPISSATPPKPTVLEPSRNQAVMGAMALSYYDHDSKTDKPVSDSIEIDPVTAAAPDPDLAKSAKQADGAKEEVKPSKPTDSEKPDQQSHGAESQDR